LVNVISFAEYYIFGALGSSEIKTVKVLNNVMGFPLLSSVECRLAVEIFTYKTL